VHESYVASCSLGKVQRPRDGVFGGFSPVEGHKDRSELQGLDNRPAGVGLASTHVGSGVTPRPIQKTVANRID
jgi:hypothetical protein